VLGGSIHVVGGWDGESRLTSMERYRDASNSWSEVSGGELNETRNLFGVHALCVEVNLIDSLMDNAKYARR
jgi:hypothetical protein